MHHLIIADVFLVECVLHKGARDAAVLFSFRRFPEQFCGLKCWSQRMDPNAF